LSNLFFPSIQETFLSEGTKLVESSLAWVEWAGIVRRQQCGQVYYGDWSCGFFLIT
jgi:hypothetical protein